MKEGQPRIVRILYLEDDPLDVEPVAERLRRTGIAFELAVARDREEFERAASGAPFELILADYRLPAYDGMAALAYAREHQEGVPFILISGVLGEEAAVDCVLRGATDYVLKQHLDRLVAAVPRALREAAQARLRREAEAALRASEERQRLLLERIPAHVWTTDRDLRFTTSAGSGLSMLGLPRGAVVGTSLYRVLHTEDRTHPMIAAHLRALEGSRVTFDMVWQDRVFHTTVDPFVAEDGRGTGCVGVALDITERADAERALRQSEGRLRRLVDANIIGIFFWERDGRVTEANRAFLELVGYTEEEVRSGRVSWVELTPSYERARDERAREEIVATGKCRPYEKTYIARSGEFVPVLMAGASLGGEPRTEADRGVAFVLDLREQVRLRAQHADMLARETRARRDTEAANVRLVLLAEAGKVLARTMRAQDTFDALARLLISGLADWCLIVSCWPEGTDATDAAARPHVLAAAHADPEKLPRVRELRDLEWSDEAREGPLACRMGKTFVAPDLDDAKLAPDAPELTPLGTRDPKHLAIARALGMRSLLCVPIAGRKGVEAVAMLVSSTDPRRYGPHDVLAAEEIAGRASVSLENGRLLSEALDAVRARDEFISIAAHELRTPLTSLLLQIQNLRHSLERQTLDSRTGRRAIEVTERQATHLARLVDNLLDLVRASRGQLSIVAEPLDLAALVRDVVAAMRPESEGVGCTVTLTAPPTLIGEWDLVRMRQVITNLLSNALKFGRGHPIEVGVTSTPDRVQISVCDHGIGISKEEQARIFGRFERAVSARHYGGLGLGLYVAAQIARAHGGTLAVTSEPRQGACFTVDLPRKPCCA